MNLEPAISSPLTSQVIEEEAEASLPLPPPISTSQVIEEEAEASSPLPPPISTSQVSEEKAETSSPQRQQGRQVSEEEA